MRKDESLDQLIKVALPRLEKLCQRASKFPEEREGLVWESLDQLSNAFEELHVMMEELQLRNEELEALNQSLRGECRRYHELFEFAPSAYLVTDLQGVIQQANQASASLLKIPQMLYLVGKPLYAFVAEEARRDFHTQLNHLQTVKEIRGWQIQLQPRQGKPLKTLCTVGVVQDSQGKAVGLRWQLQEIVECKQIEEAWR